MTFDTSTTSIAGDSASTDEPVFLEIEEVVTPSADAAEETGETSAPGWFSRKRAKAAESSKSAGRKSAAKAALPAIAARPEDQAGVVWHEPSLLQKLTYILRGKATNEYGDEVENPGYLRFKQLLAFAMTGYGVSLIFHTLVTGALALVVFESTKSGDLNLFASQATDDIVEFDEIDTAIDVSGGAQEQLELPHMEVVNIRSNEFVQPTLPNEMKLSDVAKGNGDGNSDGSGKGPRFRMPSAGKAVTKGSFTVWTVPEDPAPGQNYHIIIQVKLPDRVKRYRRSDLSGTVVGTDGYRQLIPGVRRGWLNVKENKAQVAVFVPAAASLVRDKIVVRSKILKEEQDLEIVF